MLRSKRHFFILFMGSLILVACGTPSPRTDTDAGFQATLEEAEQAAQAFFQAWQDLDYTSMYALLSPDSRTRYDSAAFQVHYDTATAQMKLGSIETQIHDVSRQGTTAIIRYDVTFYSDILGDIVDSDRTLRLITTPEGWRIHWSTMDILSDLAEGMSLEFIQTMPARGNIYDRHGNILVDQNGRSVLLYMTQDNIPDYNACLNALSRILRREKSSVEDQMARFLPETLFLVDEISAETYQAEGRRYRTYAGSAAVANCQPAPPASTWEILHHI